MWHTIKIDLKKGDEIFHCHITQKLSEHNQGHYCGYINDEEDHTIAVIQSPGAVQPPLRLEEATEICKHYIDGDSEVTRRMTSLEYPLHPQTILEHKLPE
jgi:hypothetical protein